MFSEEEYKALVIKYGNYSSWALWSYEKENDTSVIINNFNLIHSRYVLIGLNISASLKDVPWINFHGGKHDRKLKYACNDTVLKGSYITDLFKDLPESNSIKLKNILNDDLININLQKFKEEMNDIKINKETVFLALGDSTKYYYEKNFQKYFKNKVINYYHYSNYSFTDKEWVDGLWKKINIVEDFDRIKAKYK